MQVHSDVNSDVRLHGESCIEYHSINTSVICHRYRNMYIACHMEVSMGVYSQRFSTLLSLYWCVDFLVVYGTDSKLAIILVPIHGAD